MIINVPLSDVGIRNAISKLRQYENNLYDGIHGTVETMINEGEEIAQSAYGGMATAIGQMIDDTTGIILSIGETNLIAEFGAGDATLDPSGYFENSPDIPVEPGSYSLLVGTEEYFATGKWHFGGTVFTEVKPRQGLYQAKEHIVANFASTLQEVIVND